MKEKERIDYIDFCCIESGRNGVKFQKEYIAGIPTLKVLLCERKKRRNIRHPIKCFHRVKNFCVQSNLKKVRRELKKYQAEESVIHADCKAAKMLGIEDALFQARKLELLRKREFIFKRLKPAKRGVRKSMLLILDSTKWTAKDIRFILLTAKNYYEDISIVLKEKLSGLGDVAEDLYGEWGVVVHIWEKGMSEAVQEYDFALFLLKKADWKEIGQYRFCKAYAVMEQEEGIVRIADAESGKSEGEVYSGLLYEKQYEQIPYGMAVNIAYQNMDFYKKIAFSLVAIYRLECYNRS